MAGDATKECLEQTILKDTLFIVEMENRPPLEH